MALTPTLQMLWESDHPSDVLSTRFGFRDADVAARWVASTLDEHWGLAVDHCERIVMSSHNALAWVTTPAGRMIMKWSIATDRFLRLEALADLTAWLAHEGQPVSVPIAALDGRLQVVAAGTSLSLQRQLSGEHLDTDEPDQVREAGLVLGRLHDALAAYEDEVPDLTSPAASLSRQICDWLDTRWGHIPAPALDGLRQLVAETVPGALPTQVVHGDYRSANIVVDRKRIVAVIDFEEARIDHRIAELARSAVLLGTRFHDWAPVSPEVHTAFLHGYESHRPLTPTEASWWRPLVLWYSLTMASVEGKSAAWIASAMDQLSGFYPGKRQGPECQTESVQVRRAVEADWESARAIRLEALQDSPLAFASTYEREIALDKHHWQGRIAGSAQFLAIERSGTVVGTATGFVDPRDPSTTHLVAMYVTATARQQGVGELLVRAVADEARAAGAHRVRLHVVETNPGAERLYARCGFVRTGATMPLPHRPDLLEHEMELRLS